MEQTSSQAKNWIATASAKPRNDGSVKQGLLQGTLDYSGSVTPQSLRDSSPQVEPLGKATNDDVLLNDKNSTNNVSQANSLISPLSSLTSNNNVGQSN